jgi:bifunctional non-homologous end joining protein LigD
LLPSDLEGARKAAMPARVEPALATLVEKPFSHPDWLFEIKWDGVRALARVRDGRLELRSRTGRIITAEYPELETLPKRLAVHQAILDGEIVVLDEKGRSDFERLQARMNVSHPSSALRQQAPPTYYIFDLLYCDGYDLRGVPLVERKRLLQQVLEPDHMIRYSDHQLEHGRELFDLARRQGLEGIVGKQARSPYPGRRSPLWVKFKVTRELDSVVGGWTAPRGSREHFGALLLGLYAGKKLRIIGGVGSGFTGRSQKEVFEQIRRLQSKQCPFETAPETQEKAWWTKPQLVARVKYSSWTEERRLRAPIFLSLRKDLAPEECRFEEKTPTQADPTQVAAPAVTERALTREEDIEGELYRGRAENVSIELAGERLRLTHLNKVFFPESRYTKRDLLAYYYRMGDYVLPFLKDRPLVLRRYPNGITGESFFQKEAGETAPDWMKTVTVYSDERKADMEYFTAGDRAALLYLTNLGCIDHNPWSSRADDLDHPDYVFFDLDPTEGTRFATTVAVARVADGIDYGGRGDSCYQRRASLFRRAP